MTRRLRLGLLVYGLDRPLGGVTRVALELGRALQARPDLDVTFLVPYRRGPFVDEPGVKTFHLPGCRLIPGLMLLGGPLIALAAGRLGLDLVHDPIGVSPFTLGRWAGRFKRVVTIHDAIAFEYPRGYPLLNNLLHRAYVPLTLGNVDAVATDSEHARRALGRHLRLDVSKVPVIPLGTSASFAPVPLEEASAVARRYGLERPYILYLGAFQARKNVLALIEAFARIADRLPNHRLALVGSSQWRYPAVADRLRALGLGDRIALIGHAQDADLPALYSAAELYVLPSLYEGFGIPILEAMACGTPVASSTASSLPEVAGDAAVLFDPTDVDAIAEAIVRVATDRELADDLRRRGRARAAELTWTRMAGSYVDLYRGLIDPG